MPEFPRLVSTGIAAQAIGVDPSTLARWWKEKGIVKPTLVTAGGHARWNVEQLREDLRALAKAAAEADDQK